MLNTTSYEELRSYKLSVSLLLFLFLNIVFSLFFISSALNNSRNPTIASILIVVACTLIFIFNKLKLLNHPDKLNIYALIIGLFWAWHTVVRFREFHAYSHEFLLFSLMVVFFISAISLSESFSAFCLHSLPPALTILILDQYHHSIIILLTIVLPLISHRLHALMQKRSETFTTELIKRLSEEREKFSDLSMLDPLTGLFNRRGLKNKLNNLDRDPATSHYILLLDIDHFKAYNDNYGHTMGDNALVAVAVAIRDVVRSRDIVVRYGGEEFLILLIDVDESYALSSAENVRQAVLNLNIPHMFNDKVSTTVTVSAGVAIMADSDIEAALVAADSALYLAKNRGRNSVEIAIRQSQTINKRRIGDRRHEI
ncbi:GGDEF domain-containing protein [Acerihabitans sp. TG2]|uniref:GGDEF domain-containing protein n=1 Tax=Acerihabitans sp. TG2 TaxID=3096008 RepID=UPI002B231C0A|nr:GGDEF domain-containing protein [Acerihabitans sp. TG2]MEA9392915.1 GGDEF domain-containing protein [Acerihabitans sp. TG2]